MDGWGGEREAARAEAGERIGGRGSENCAATRRRAIFGAGAIADRRARATPRAPHGAPRRRRAPLRERALNAWAGLGPSSHLGTLSNSSGRRSAMTPALCMGSTFCGRVASSATVCTNATRSFWYFSKTCRTARVAAIVPGFKRRYVSAGRGVGWWARASTPRVGIVFAERARARGVAKCLERRRSSRGRRRIWYGARRFILFEHTKRVRSSVRSTETFPEPRTSNLGRRERGGVTTRAPRVTPAAAAAAAAARDDGIEMG